MNVDTHALWLVTMFALSVYVEMYGFLCSQLSLSKRNEWNEWMVTHINIFQLNFFFHFHLFKLTAFLSLSLSTSLILYKTFFLCSCHKNKFYVIEEKDKIFL